MPPLQSPGGAAVAAMAEILAERERTKQQALVNAHTALQDQLDQQREVRQAQAQQEEAAYRRDVLHQNQADKAKQEGATLANRMVTEDLTLGDIPNDPKTLETLKTYRPDTLEPLGTVLPSQGVGPAEPRLGVTGPATAVRFIGTSKEQAAEKKLAAQKQAQEQFYAMVDNARKTGVPLDPVLTNAQWREAFPTAGNLPEGTIQPKPTGPKDILLQNRDGSFTNLSTGQKSTQYDPATQQIEHAPAAPAGGALQNVAPDEMDMLARDYVLKGPSALANLGIGNSGMAMKQAVIARAAKYDPKTGQFNASIPPNLQALRTQYASDQVALTNLEKISTAAEAFTNTAEYNRSILDQIAKDIPDTGVTFLNKPYRALSTMFGSETMARLDAIRQSLQNEYARIVSSPGMTGVVTDTMRSKLDQILSPSATVGQMKAALDTLAQEAGNRRKSYHEQSEALRHKLDPQAETSGMPPALTAPSVAPVEYVRDPKTGQIVKK